MRPEPLDSNRSRRLPAAVAVFAASLTACSPTFDWRDAQPRGTSVRMMFPCRPEHAVRMVALGGQPLRMTIASCSAAATTFGLAHLEVAEPQQVASVLEALRALAAGNIGVGAVDGEPHRVAGATPNPRMERVRLAGHLPDGRPVAMQAIFFVEGLRVHQASVVGEQIPQDEARTFFAAIRVGR